MSEGKQGKSSFLLGLFAGMAVLSTIAFFVLLIIVFSGGEKVDNDAPVDDPIVAEQPTEPELAPVPPIADNEPFIGGEDASVVLIEYTDFECPFCLRHHPTVQSILEEYGDKIKYVLRHYPLTSIHPQAQKAAEAFECAAEQDGVKAYDLAERIWEANEKGNMSVLTWKTSAAELGFNSSEFNDCLEDGKYTAKVNQMAAAGNKAGVDGTPATFINGQMVSGALPLDTFKGIIDSIFAE
jgi:protein-disulfide isomerase